MSEHPPSNNEKSAPVIGYGNPVQPFEAPISFIYLAAEPGYEGFVRWKEELEKEAQIHQGVITYDGRTLAVVYKEKPNVLQHLGSGLLNLLQISNR